MVQTTWFIGAGIMDILIKKLERLEFLAHVNAFTKLGTFYWENFLTEEITYNAKNKNKYIRKW